MKSSFQGYLSHDEITEIHEIAVDLRLAESRDALLGGIDRGFVASLAKDSSPTEQLSKDLEALNARERLKDGGVPLAIWLANALRFRSSYTESDVFTRALDKVRAKAGQAPPQTTTPTPSPAPKAQTPPPAVGGAGYQKHAQPMKEPPMTMFPLDISGDEYRLLNQALSKAFPTRRKLEMMLQFRLGKDLNEIAAEGISLTEAVFEVIGDAKARGWLLKLALAARASNLDNPHLIEFCQHVGLAPDMPPKGALNGLQSFLKRSNGFLDVNLLRTRLGDVEARVCRIEVRLSGDEMDYGTGFLVGPDLVLTNYHVLERVIQKDVSPSNVTLRFDYKRLVNGEVANQGTCATLAPDWLLDHSPLSHFDGNEYGPLPSLDELDYALVRIERPLGSAPVGDKPEPGAPHRLWITPSAYSISLNRGDPLFIVQHPKAQPIKVALDTEAILSVNGNRTRVRYVTNTEGGSSGSPCFDANWNLVALHHWGDPDRYKPKYNQGIPIDTIVARLRANGITLPPLP